MMTDIVVKPQADLIVTERMRNHFQERTSIGWRNPAPPAPGGNSISYHIGN
jgi:hypothetical protein